MQVTISGRVADSAGKFENGRIEFVQAQRIDTGDLLVTQSVAVAQVVQGELRSLDGGEFTLPSNPNGSAVRVREMLGGRTFEWWTAVPDVEAVEYRGLPVVESVTVPASVFARPPWIVEVEQLRDTTVQAITDGTAVAESLGGLAGINTAVTAAAGSAAAASSSAEDAATEAVRAEAAASSIDMTAINARLNEVDTTLDTKAATSELTTGLAAERTHTNTQVAAVLGEVDRAPIGTRIRGGTLAKLRAGVVAGGRCVVVVVGDSFMRAQSARYIGAAERLAFRAGASAFPLLDDVPASPPGAGMTWIQGAEGSTVSNTYLPESRLVKIDAVAPDYVLHGIGVSDHYNNVSIATFKANIKAMCLRLEADTPGLVNVLVQTLPRADAFTRTLKWAAYGQALKEIAEELPGRRVYVPVGEIADLYDVGSANRFGLTAEDGVHPSHFGHKLMSEIIGQQIGVPTQQPAGEELVSITFPGTASYTTQTDLASRVLPAVSYPRLIEIVGTAYYRATFTGNGNADFMIRIKRGENWSDHGQRLLGGNVEMGIDLTRTYYVAPGEPVQVAAVVKPSPGSGSASVQINGGSTYSMLQVTEKPC